MLKLRGDGKLFNDEEAGKKYITYWDEPNKRLWAIDRDGIKYLGPSDVSMVHIINNLWVDCTPTRLEHMDEEIYNTFKEHEFLWPQP